MDYTARRRRTYLLGLFCLLALAATPFFGAYKLDVSAALQPPSAGLPSEIFWRMRIPRTLLAFVAGAALSLCGMVFQACFRNPLATPYTLGVSSGASLGAVLYLFFGGALVVAGISGLSLAAFLGALGAILSVYGLGAGRRRFSPNTMLLAGVAMSLFFSSMILFLQYFSDFGGSVRIMRWLMGGLDALGMQPVYQMLPLTAPGIALILLQSKNLNLLTLGDELAAGRGIDTVKTRRLLYFATSLTVGGVVAVCGPIGFVGMIAPHICRLLVGWDHRYLGPASFLFGGAFLAVCDAFARSIIPPAEIPVGVITALLGGPFFIWLLVRRFSTESF